MDELMTRIKNTTYGDAVAEVQKPYTSQGIEAALRGRLAETHHRHIHDSQEASQPV